MLSRDLPSTENFCLSVFIQFWCFTYWFVFHWQFVTYLRCCIVKVAGCLHALPYVLWVLMFITGSIARSASLPVFNLLRGQFWGFSPRRGNTLHRWGWNLAWRRGPFSPPPLVAPKFSAPPSGETMRQTPNVLEVQERARGPLSPCQVWWGLGFHPPPGWQKTSLSPHVQDVMLLSSACRWSVGVDRGSVQGPTDLYGQRWRYMPSVVPAHWGRWVQDQRQVCRGAYTWITVHRQDHTRRYPAHTFVVHLNESLS